MDASYRVLLGMYEIIGSSYTLRNFMSARSLWQGSSLAHGNELDDIVLGDRGYYFYGI